jgi:hypothetical protein
MDRNAKAAKDIGSRRLSHADGSGKAENEGHAGSLGSLRTNIELEGKQPHLAQNREKREEGEAEDRRMVALDMIEQVNAQAFNLVGADALQRGFAGEVEIELDVVSAKYAHGHARNLAGFAKDDALPCDGEGRVQDMCAAGQSRKLLSGCHSTRRLVKQPPFAGQGLICHYHNPVRATAAHGQSLFSGEFFRKAARVARRRRRFDGAFVDARCFALEAKP